MKLLKGSRVPQERKGRRGEANVYQKAAFPGIWVSLELVALRSEWNHLLLKGLITLLSEVFYLDRLINFSSGKREGKNQHGGLAKESTERAVLAHVCQCAALPWPQHRDTQRERGKSSVRHLRPHFWCQNSPFFPALSSFPAAAAVCQGWVFNSWTALT